MNVNLLASKTFEETGSQENISQSEDDVDTGNGFERGFSGGKLKRYPALMDSALIGDYDLKQSPSTQAFILPFMEKKILERSIRKKSYQHLHKLDGKIAGDVFTSCIKLYGEGMNSIMDDNFWRCFESKKPKAWNWNIYLWPVWAAGVVFRYFVLFPIRLVVFLLGWVLFFIGMFTVHFMLDKESPKRQHYESKFISMMCGVFCFTWGAVIRYHGSPYKPKPGQPCGIYVANHTSMIDAIIMLQCRGFSLVGQKHKGIVGYLQEEVISCLQCVWFDRGEIKDRAIVAKKLQDHAMAQDRNPLLVFPEGTCVNNEYCIQFKKGVFQLGVPICPVAIKYNKMFVDPFWNSRKQSFVMHLVELMTSWCLICDVTFLEPQKRKDDENAVEFANRVKACISKKARLKSVDFDGYMKHWKPSERFINMRKKQFASGLEKVFERVKTKDLDIDAPPDIDGSNDDSDTPPSMSPYTHQFQRSR